MGDPLDPHAANLHLRELRTASSQIQQQLAEALSELHRLIDAVSEHQAWKESAKTATRPDHVDIELWKQLDRSPFSPSRTDNKEQTP